ncbi:MAG: glucose-6-phosphate isomerase, partial [Muribaculaceae bacterium]|nr:glucose-6-phosphate isomerase [Muribaculaceae bacterium]
MSKIQVNVTGAESFISANGLEALRPDGKAAFEKLTDGTGLGNDFLGWVKLPSETSNELLDDINATAARLRELCDVVVAIGIGGSYLGAKAVIEALSGAFDSYKPNTGTKVLFAGQNIGEDYLAELQDFLKDKKFGIIVISKSGTTTEPAIAFRILREQLENQLGREEAGKRIVAVTDAKRGALRTLANTEGYKTYVIEDNVGGRFSVLTPVGLLPIAVAGFDIHALVEGAREMEKGTLAGTDTSAMTYALYRNALYRSGKKIEILVNYNPKLHFFGEWWKQLYGESEGKDNKGIFPAAVDNTTDLHSMGQWIQEGERIIFETVVSVASADRELRIPFDESNLDGLNY